MPAQTGPLPTFDDFKIVAKGQLNLPITSGQKSHTGTVNHSLGFTPTPFVFIWDQETPAYQPIPMQVYINSAVLENYRVIVTNTSLKVRVDMNIAAGGNTTYVFYYFLASNPFGF